MMSSVMCQCNGDDEMKVDDYEISQEMNSLNLSRQQTGISRSIGSNQLFSENNLNIIQNLYNR